jgi:hypothetical protein
MKTITFKFILLSAVAASGLVVAQEPKKDEAPKIPKGKFTISKETTYATGPVDKDGYIDYAAALNERLKQGVTGENNANVLLLKALGPHPDRATMPPDFFRLMGIDPPPEKGDYFVHLYYYLKDHLKINVDERYEQTNAEEDRSRRSPWRAKDIPHIASWLKVNEKPLNLVAEAAKRSQYYSPLVTRRSEKRDPQLNFLLHGVQMNRSFANALRSRAMLRLGEGDNEGAWQDSLTCHRLGRLVGRGGTMIEWLVAAALESVANGTDLEYLHHAQPDAKRIEKCLTDLNGLAPFPSLAERVDLGERLLALDTVLWTDQFWADSMAAKVVGFSNDDKQAIIDSMRQPDWDPALRSVNQWFDRLTVAARDKDRASKLTQLAQIQEELEEQVKKLRDARGLGRALAANDKEKNKLYGDYLMAWASTSIIKVCHSEDRLRQSRENARIAFALAWYRADHGSYPKDLSALAPKYLAEVPNDWFSGEPLIYRPTEKGYLLYSVGVNGEDEEGRGPDDDPRGDDIAVRMPIPEPKK